MTAVASVGKPDDGTKSSIVSDSDSYAFERNLKNVTVFQFRNGILYNSYYATGSGGTIYIDVKGNTGESYVFYALGNCGDLTESYAQGTSLQEFLTGMEIRYANPVSGIASGGIPMFCGGSTSSDGLWDGVPATFTEGNSFALTFIRLTARFNFALDISSLRYGTFTPTSLELAQSPKCVVPFMESSAPSSASDFTSGDHSSAEDLSTLSSGVSVPFYVLENARGTLLPENSDPWQKVPSSIPSESGKCTYLELTGTYTDKSGGLTAEHTYRMYLGADNRTNFDIYRNYEYTLTLTLSDDGFLRSSWKMARNILSDTRTMEFDQNIYEVVYDTPMMAKLITSGNIGVSYSLSQNLLDAGVTYDSTTRTLSQSIKLDADITGTLTATTWDKVHTASAQVIAKKYTATPSVVITPQAVTLKAAEPAQTVQYSYSSGNTMTLNFPKDLPYKPIPETDNGETVSGSFVLSAGTSTPPGIYDVTLNNKAGAVMGTCRVTVLPYLIWEDTFTSAYIAQKKVFKVFKGCEVSISDPDIADLTYLGSSDGFDRYSLSALLPGEVEIGMIMNSVDDTESINILAPTFQIGSSLDVDITGETCAGVNYGNLSYYYLNSEGVVLHDSDFDSALFETYLRPEVTAREGSPEFANTHSCFSVSIDNLLEAISVNIISLEDTDGNPLPFTNYTNRDATFWFRPPYMKMINSSLGDKEQASPGEVRAVFGGKNITKYFSDGYDMPETYIIDSPKFNVISDDLHAPGTYLEMEPVTVSVIDSPLFDLSDFSQISFSGGLEYDKDRNVFTYYNEVIQDEIISSAPAGIYQLFHDLVARLCIGGTYKEYTFPMEIQTANAVTRLRVGDITYVATNGVTSVRCPVNGVVFEDWTTSGIYGLIPQDAIKFRLTLNDTSVYDYWWRAGYGMGYMELPVGTTDYGLVLNTSNYTASDGGILISDYIWVGLADLYNSVGNSDPFTCYGTSYTSHVGYTMPLAN